MEAQDNGNDAFGLHPGETTLKKAGIFLALMGLAFTTTCAQADNIDNRIQRQQGHIANKRKNKKISVDQAVRADNATYRIQGEEQRMRDRHHGKLTRNDRIRLNRQLNRNRAGL